MPIRNVVSVQAAICAMYESPDQNVSEPSKSAGAHTPESIEARLERPTRRDPHAGEIALHPVVLQLV